MKLETGHFYYNILLMKIFLSSDSTYFLLDWAIRETMALYQFDIRA